MRPLIKGIIAYTALAVAGLVALLVMVIALGMSGLQSPFPPREITQRKPYAGFVGAEYRTVSDVIAHAWNDYPDKQKLLTITLYTPPGVANRFVSYRVPLQRGQTVRILSAWQQLQLFGYHRYYVVSVPGAGLPEGIPIKVSMDSEGRLDPKVYAPVAK